MKRKILFIAVIFLGCISLSKWAYGSYSSIANIRVSPDSYPSNAQLCGASSNPSAMDFDLTACIDIGDEGSVTIDTKGRHESLRDLRYIARRAAISTIQIGKQVIAYNTIPLITNDSGYTLCYFYSDIVFNCSFMGDQGQVSGPISAIVFLYNQQSMPILVKDGSGTTINHSNTATTAQSEISLPLFSQIPNNCVKATREWKSGDSFMSNNGNYGLFIEPNGNVNLYRTDLKSQQTLDDDDRLLFSTNTKGKTSNPLFIFQDNNDVVLYDGDTNDKLWSSASSYENDYNGSLCIENDGDFVLYKESMNSNGELTYHAEWSTNTGQIPYYSTYYIYAQSTTGDMPICQLDVSPSGYITISQLDAGAENGISCYKGISHGYQNQITVCTEETCPSSRRLTISNKTGNSVLAILDHKGINILNNEERAILNMRFHKVTIESSGGDKICTLNYDDHKHIQISNYTNYQCTLVNPADNTIEVK
ncbi:MAG: hypothetical protein AAGB12_13140 [Pseudomonadota bacterium]